MHESSCQKPTNQQPAKPPIQESPKDEKKLILETPKQVTDVKIPEAIENAVIIPKQNAVIVPKQNATPSQEISIPHKTSPFQEATCPTCKENGVLWRSKPCLHILCGKCWGVTMNESSICPIADCKQPIKTLKLLE